MSDEEKYMEWLERLEVPIEETVSIGRFQDYLNSLISPPKGMTEITENMLDALWSGVEQKYEKLAPEGVRALTIEYPWGSQVRYIIEGHPGLWGYVGMIEVMGEEP